MYLQFDTQTQAQAELDKIHANMQCAISRDNGYQMITWAEPMQDINGKWVFVKPNAQAAFISGVTLDDIMDGVVGVEVETVVFPSEGA